MDDSEYFRAACQRFAGAGHFFAPELRRIQNTKIRELLQDTVENVPLYRDLYRKHGVSIEAITDGDDLWRLPSVTKGDYLDAGPIRYVDERLDICELRTRTTSGSLGRALTIYATAEEAV